jgi:hypothetical protein
MTDLLNAPANTSTSGTGGSFPQSTVSSLGSFNANDILALSPAQFAADYSVTSTELPSFIDATTGKLNANAAYLGWYYSLNQSERQSIQSAMVNVGSIPATDANGLNNTTALDAFKSLIGTTSAQGTDVVTWLDQNGSGTNAIQNQISAGLTKSEESATQPIIATTTNSNTLAADITSAFDNALGYAPDQDQISSFISQIQGQETNYAEAPRAEAQAQITQAQEEESALNKLGPDGIDTVIQAYQAAINGTKMIGAGTTQGPQLSQNQSTLPVMSGANTTAPVMTPTSQQLPPGMNIPNGPGVTNAPGYVREGTIGNLINTITTGDKGPSQTRVGDITTIHGEKTSTKKVGSTQLAPTHFTPPTNATYGGLYALNAADWKQAQSEYGPAKKYATPGQAPQSVQLAAFTSLLNTAYDSNGGSWSKAITQIASGTPFGSAEGTHLTNFGTSIANEVNNQISTLQNQVNNSSVTIKEQAPDSSGAYSAEAAAAAKQADPVGYYAGNAASWGGVLDQMLSGAPLMYQEGTSDTFSGPVPTAEAGSPAPTTTGTAPTPAATGAP